MIKADHKHERAQFIMSVWTKTSPGFKRGRIITSCPKCGKILDTQLSLKSCRGKSGFKEGAGLKCCHLRLKTLLRDILTCQL